MSVQPKKTETICVLERAELHVEEKAAQILDIAKELK